MSADPKLLYQSPWICRLHGFITMDKVLFFQHMGSQVHHHKGTNGICEMCTKFLPTFTAPYFGLSEPVIILCESCVRIPDVYNLVRDKRNAKYPALELEQNAV